MRSPCLLPKASTKPVPDAEMVLTSMPRALIRPDEPLLKRPLLQIPNEIPVVPLRLSTSLLRPTSSPTHGIPTRSAAQVATISGWRVVGRTGLQPDGLCWVEVTSHPLYSRRNPALLLLHCRRPLPAAGRLLRVHVGLGVVGGRHLGCRLVHDRLPVRTKVTACLRRVGRWLACVRSRSSW